MRNAIQNVSRAWFETGDQRYGCTKPDPKDPGSVLLAILIPALGTVILYRHLCLYVCEQRRVRPPKKMDMDRPKSRDSPSVERCKTAKTAWAYQA